MTQNLPDRQNKLKPSKNTSNRTTPKELALEGRDYPAISDNDSVTDKHIRMALARVYVIIGLHPDYYPQDVVDQMLVQYIRQHMGDLSLRDILNAFMLGVQKKLQVKNKKGQLEPLNMDPHFNFSIRFLENVMSAYREYRKPFIRQQQEVKQIEKKTAWTVEDSIQTYVEQYERYLQGKKINDFGGVIFKALRDDLGFVRVTDQQLQEKATELLAEGKATEEMGLNEFVNKLSNRGKGDKFASMISRVKNQKITAFFQELQDTDYTPSDFKEMLEDKLIKKFE